MGKSHKQNDEVKFEHNWKKRQEKKINGNNKRKRTKEKLRYYQFEK